MSDRIGFPRDSVRLLCDGRRSISHQQHVVTAGWTFSVVLCICLFGTGEMPVAAQRSPGRSIASAPVPQEVEKGRVERLERWLKLAARHTPGEDDEELGEIAGWPNPQLKALWLDTNALVQVMRRVGKLSPTLYVRPAEQKASVQMRYSKAQFHRLEVLACAAGGLLFEAECMALRAENELDGELRQLAALVRASNDRGDRNYIVRRGALLHADVPVLAPLAMAAAPESRTSIGPNRFRMEISDGREVDLSQSAVHWEIARMLLDLVVPRGSDRPAPGGDAMVRAWYCATVAWMQLREDHDKLHLDHARELFPADPTLLMLSGFQRETFAGLPVQTAVQSAVLPTGVTLDVGSERAELREAESFFQRALELSPDHAEGRMHHGRVLALLGRHAEAVVELRRAAPALSDPDLEYFARLFLGAEEETIGNRDAARTAYERAASLAPMAQSPLLALSQLARRSGDRPGALRAIDRLFALSGAERSQNDDPWWWYYVSQARDADDRLAAVHEPFRAERLQ
jgi:tetratricopeptide (TPR) repeat protein